MVVSNGWPVHGGRRRLACHLKQGRRVPSIVVAEALISGLKLDPFEAEQLRAVALCGVGRDFDPSRYERARQ